MIFLRLKLIFFCFILNQDLMSKQSSLNYQDNYSFHYEISIRNEYTRFACMFYLFTTLALLSTIFLFIFANNSYHDESESIQRRFIAYSILGSISLALFFVFLVGSLVYTCKLIRKFRLKSSPSNLLPISSNSTRTKTSKPLQSFIMNTDESYYTSTKTVAEQKSRTTNHSSSPCQTDV
jgi:hypothetical protein